MKIVAFGMQSARSYHGELEPIQGWYAPEFGRQLENHVWGMSFAGRLPIWSGYVLWPRADDEIDVEISAISPSSCRVDVRSTGGCRRLLFDSDKAILAGE